MSNLDNSINDYVNCVRSLVKNFDEKTKEIISSKEAKNDVKVSFNSLRIENVYKLLNDTKFDGYDDFIKFALFKNVILGKNYDKIDDGRINTMYSNFINDKNAVDRAFQKIIGEISGRDCEISVFENRPDDEKSYVYISSSIEYSEFFNDFSE